MKIVFFGTPDYVLPIVAQLHKVYNKPNAEQQLIAVVTQPPQKVGREQIVTRSAVDNWGYKHKIPVVYEHEDIPKADVAVLAAYGAILPQNVIDQFPLGIINIHPSLLPHFRGASPIQATIATGSTPGVTVIKMDAQMDHGPIISSFKDDLLNEDTNENLRVRLFERSAEFLIELLPAYLSGKVKLKPQKHDQATFTKLITKQDGYIPGEFIEHATKGLTAPKPWSISFIKDYEQDPTPANIERFLRSITPWPGAWTEVEIKSERLRLKLLSAHIQEDLLVLDEVQLEGKSQVTFTQFTQGYPDSRFI